MLKTSYLYIISLVIILGFNKLESKEKHHLALLSDNLIINGDFSSGNVGFTSDYSFGIIGNFNMGFYAITQNPQLYHPGFVKCIDHTNDSAKLMMIFDSDTVKNKVVWSQTVPIIPHQVYKFEMWATKLVYYDDSFLQIKINGIPLDSIFHVTHQSGFWSSFNGNWCSNSDNYAKIEIINTTIKVAGNDLAIDDISFNIISYSNLKFTLNQDSLEFIDSTMYLQQKCNSITITNNSLKDVTINDAYLFRNTNFSVPLNQFPITIPAKDTANLIVCFKPNNLGEFRDTMNVTDDCREYIIPLLSYGIIDYQNNDSKCNVALKFSDYILPNNYSVVFNSPIPNPSNSIVNVNYEITRPFDKNIEISSCISDILGNKSLNYTNIINSSILIDRVVKEKGTITYNVEELASGTYLLLCTIQGKIVSFPIAIYK